VKRLLTAAAILGLVAFMLPATAGIALAVDPVAPGTVNLLKVVDGGSALPSDFDIGLNPGFGEVGLTLGGPYHSGDSVAVIPGTYWLFEMARPAAGGGYHEESITCTSPNHATVSEVPAPNSPVNDKIGLNVTVAAGEVWNCTITNMEPPASLDISFTDCTVATGEGAIIVTGFNDPSQKVVVTPGDLVITKNGTYPLAPGDYSWQYTDFTGGASNDFTVGACQITGWDVSTADCTVADGQGSITVTGFNGNVDDGQQVAVNKGFWVQPIEGVDPEQVLHITANGTYPLDPGNYNWGYGDHTGGGGPGNDFTIGPCPSPGPSPSPSPSPSVSPSPTPTPVASPTPKPAVTPTPKPTSTTLAAVITLPQTGTIGASTGGSSSPLVPISIALLLVAATGLMLTRRPKSR
jgi:hypothetical protein